MLAKTFSESCSLQLCLFFGRVGVGGGGQEEHLASKSISYMRRASFNRDVNRKSQKLILFVLMVAKNGKFYHT